MNEALVLPTRSRISSGTVVGRHVVLQPLGRATYEAHDPEHERRVVLKLLPLPVGATARLRFLREARALIEPTHPSILAIHDVGTFDEQGFVAMELVHGWAMNAWLPMPVHWTEAIVLMRGAGQALAAAHRRGVLHRSFGPRHVMIGLDGRIRVKGFALELLAAGSVLQGEGTPAVVWSLDQGVLLADPSSMAPESILEGRFTAASDQWSFCATLWEALYGRRPWTGRSVLELLTCITEGTLRPPPPESDVPAWLRRACERGLSVDPSRRWPSMDALLEALAEGDPEHPRGSSAPGWGP